MAISPFFTKAALGVGAASATAAGAAYASGVFSPSDEKKELISKLIKTTNPDKRIIIASSGDDPHWKEAWKRYREDNSPDSDVWKLKNWNKSSTPVTSSETALSNFMSECASRLSLEISGVESNLYKEVLKYCTRDTLVEDWVKESGKSLRVKGDGKSQEWKDLWTKYRTANKDKDQGKDEWGIFKKKWTDITTEDAPSEFRDKCETESKLKSALLSEDSVQKVLAYCI
ncbi:hypothetical protein HF1_02860 [Mycoplasma haemofelis str. Langford 1]|uniref:Lipoprotein n=1 Tax=Mycoplasma haemofelis (strain Langford 1) TaxID=941640 RepID=E8ZGM3_MYCHL|nr:hypothetical protein [Mycoplasma haemofelis]CBY92294.1 hypothetical protein HF1_02860 [Mycoplasma haemofelis str. Langford 1]